MTYLLDTNTCIRFLSGSSVAVQRRIDRIPLRDIMLCSVVKAELFAGALKSARPQKNFERLEGFFSRFVSLPFDDASSLEYGRIRSRLERAGTPIGPNDLLIAAIARANGLVLVTHNTREFQRVAGLEVEDWESPIAGS
ncbi:MAG: type II toxin-antitoxin system VapC family toxin [Acidobacteria bacterium]|nr:type II toxin-antitoxin system VapC family toxin [Acidobacteriota bacterium]